LDKLGRDRPVLEPIFHAANALRLPFFEHVVSTAVAAVAVVSDRKSLLPERLPVCDRYPP
jgi:hypothetical protein